MPQPDSCKGCPLYGIGTGFVLGSGDPVTAKIGLLLEAPGKDEVIWKIDEQEEIERRRVAYPGIPEEFIKRGQPVVGKAGGTLFGWGLVPVQLTRRNVFIDNTLRCLPPKGKNNEHYPVKEVRKKAEAWCRQYDRWGEYKPTVALVQIHPAAIAREPTPLPLMVKTYEKAKHFSLGGEKPLVMCGGKATQLVLGYGSTIQKWLGHYDILKEDWYMRVLRRLNNAVQELSEKISEQPKVAKGKQRKTKNGLFSLVLSESGVTPGADAPVPKRKRRRNKKEREEISQKIEDSGV